MCPSTTNIQTPLMHSSSQHNTSNTLLKCDSSQFNKLFSNNSSQCNPFNVLISNCNNSSQYDTIYLNRTPPSLCSPLTLYQLHASRTPTNHSPLKKVLTKGTKPWSMMSMRLEQIMRYATLIFISLPFKLKSCI